MGNETHTVAMGTVQYCLWNWRPHVLPNSILWPAPRGFEDLPPTRFGSLVSICMALSFELAFNKAWDYSDHTMNIRGLISPKPCLGICRIRFNLFYIASAGCYLW